MLAWTLCIMLNLILKIAVSIDCYKWSWAKGQGEPPNVRTSKQNIFFQSRKTNQFCIKQILYFHCNFDQLTRAISMSVFWPPFYTLSQYHSCNLAVVKYCCFPRYLQILPEHEFDSLFLSLFSHVPEKAVLLPTFTSLGFCHSLVHNDSTKFSDHFLFSGDLMSPWSYTKVNAFCNF